MVGLAMMAIEAPASAGSQGGNILALAGKPLNFNFTNLSHGYGFVYNNDTTARRTWAVPVTAYGTQNVQAWSAFTGSACGTTDCKSTANLVTMYKDGTVYGSTTPVETYSAYATTMNYLGQLYIPADGAAYVDFTLAKPYVTYKGSARVVSWYQSW